MKRNTAGNGAMAKAAACRALTDAEIERVLAATETVRERLLFTLGLMSGFRLCSLLSLTIGDARTALETGRLHLSSAGGKGKARAHSVALTRDGLSAIGAQVDSLVSLGEDDRLASDAPLFQSRKRAKDGKPGCIQRAQGYRDLKELFERAKVAGLETPGLVASHVMRKTWTHKTHDGLQAAAKEGKLRLDPLEALRRLGGWKYLQSVSAYLPSDDGLDAVMLGALSK